MVPQDILEKAQRVEESTDDLQAKIKFMSPESPQFKITKQKIVELRDVLLFIIQCINTGPSLGYFFLSGVLMPIMGADPSISPVHLFPALRKAEGSNEASVREIGVSVLWAQSGFPRIVLGHKLAASLMCTTMPAEAMADLVPPWTCFAIDVPDRLLPMIDLERGHTIEGEFVDHLFVYRSEKRFEVFAFQRNGVKQTFFLLDTEAFSGFVNEVSEHDRPMLILLARLVTGVIAELSNTPSVRSSSTAGESQRSGPPKIRTYQLTRNVKVDCRDAVRSYLLGHRHSAPSVQFMVRGHWRHQAHGPQRSERKWIQIEPYWKGPEDAPIAVRGHAVK